MIVYTNSTFHSNRDVGIGSNGRHCLSNKLTIKITKESVRGAPLRKSRYWLKESGATDLGFEHEANTKASMTGYFRTGASTAISIKEKEKENKESSSF